MRRARKIADRRRWFRDSAMCELLLPKSWFVAKEGSRSGAVQLKR
jgi:hypothetical protein